MTTEASFLLEQLDEGITRIELAPLSDLPEKLATTVNVYLVGEDSPALINAGHPAQAEALAAALRECGTGPDEIERIVATSWQIDVAGGATRFPRADLFVLSPDMQAPRDYEMHIDRRRQQIKAKAAELAAVDDAVRLHPVDEAIERFYPRMSRDLQFAPLRNGHYVQAGPLRLEVLATGGPGPGHMALYCSEQRLLFAGDFAMSGLPGLLDDAQAYLVSMERLAELPSQLVLSNRHRVYKQGQWTVSRAGKFLNNFLSNAPAVLVRAPTVREFIERDRGTEMEDPTDLVLMHELFTTLFEELVRTQTIAAEGQGLERRYGVDIDDPRQDLRRH